MTDFQITMTFFRHEKYVEKWVTDATCNYQACAVQDTNNFD